MDDKKITDTIYEELLRQLLELKDSKDYKDLLALPNTPEHKSLLCWRLDIWKIHHSWDGIGKFINCFYGIPFEYYVARRVSEVKVDRKRLWRLISWRGDKFESGKVFPESNSYADLLCGYDSDKEIGGFKRGDRIAIECKWTEYEEGKTFCEIASSKTLCQNKVKEYTRNAVYEGAVCFFQAIGIGWIPAKLEPEAFYLIPVTKFKESEDIDIEQYRVGESLKLEKAEAVIVAKAVHKYALIHQINHFTQLKKELGIVDDETSN